MLGASAGLKHFGKRRLGRAGLDDTYPVSDNVWDVDCSDLINANVNGIAVHGEYFNPVETKTYALMRAILEGNDRSVLIKKGLVPTAVPREQIVARPRRISLFARTVGSFLLLCFCSRKPLFEYIRNLGVYFQPHFFLERGKMDSAPRTFFGGKHETISRRVFSCRVARAYGGWILTAASFATGEFG